MRLLTRYAVKNQYVASTAACAFAPKLATQTLDQCRPQYGGSRVRAKMPVHRNQDGGRRLQGKRCASDGRKKETDGERTGCSIRLCGTT